MPPKISKVSKGQHCLDSSPKTRIDGILETGTAIHISLGPSHVGRVSETTLCMTVSQKGEIKTAWLHRWGGGRYG